MSVPTPYRLHRSVIFWTGLALLLAAGLGWWYSWREVLALRQGSLTAMHASGGLTITWNPAEERPLEFLRTSPSAAVQDIRWPFFPKPYAIAGQELASSGIKLQPRTLEQWHRSWIGAYPRSVSLVFVPDWLLAGALLLSWGSVIAWRVHRGLDAVPVASPEERHPKVPRIAARSSPPPVPKRATWEPGTSRVNWANVVPRSMTVPGSPWAYSGVLPPLTETPMPLRRES